MRAREVLRCINGGRASVVSGATGCGKTTQVPQFVFEEAIRDGRGGECSVIITQPRRLSAIAVAERVAQERCERVGDTVGYSIDLESRQSSRHASFILHDGHLASSAAERPGPSRGESRHRGRGARARLTL